MASDWMVFRWYLGDLESFWFGTPSYRSLAVQAAGAVVAKAKSLNEVKYLDLSHTHEFAPIAMESSGVFGPQSLTFLKELGRKLRYQTGEEKAATYLIQCLPMTVQRGNAISILGGLDSRHCTWTSVFSLFYNMLWIQKIFCIDI